MKIKVTEIKRTLEGLNSVIMNVRNLDKETKEILLENEKELSLVNDNFQKSKDFKDFINLRDLIQYKPSSEREKFNIARKDKAVKFMESNKGLFGSYNQGNEQQCSPKYSSVFPDRVIIPTELTEEWKKEVEDVINLYPEVKKENEKLKKIDNKIVATEVEYKIKYIPVSQTLNFTPNEYNNLKLFIVG